MKPESPNLDPPELSGRAKVIAAVVLLACLVLVGGLWICLRTPPLIAAAIGDATAPIVGVITAIALGATAWSVHLQRHAIRVQLQELQAQRTELTASRTTMEEQTKAQNQLAELQRTQLRDAELRELRSAYATWFAAAQTWLSSLHGYGLVLAASGDPLGSGAIDDEKVHRLRAAMWHVMLLDMSSSRVVRVKSLSAPIGLGGDTKPATKDEHSKFGERVRDVTFERLRELESFQEAVANWFKTGEEKPFV